MRIGVYENAPKIFTSTSGKPASIFIDIIENIAKDEGWDLQYASGAWGEGLDRLAGGEIDLMPDVAYTADREKIYTLHKVPARSMSFFLRNDEGTIAGFIGLIRDITERVRAKKTQKDLELQLHQARKMEPIGRLAGSVAHDFNNMLSVIVGYSELALVKLDPVDKLYGDLREIHKAAVRSTDITRQLLAFARKQIIAPIALDLNEAVEGILKMLRRLIGEDIDLAWLPGIGPLPVIIDPSQVDQLLANLCVNARDTINGVGRITIETDTATFDAAYFIDHPGFIPGDYVILAVSDDGSGMDRDTAAKIFEPFFTTKALGQGRDLDWPRSMASQNRIKALSMSTVNRAKGPFSKSTWPATPTRRSLHPEENPAGIPR